MVSSPLPYLPEIYDDELFYSFFARYKRDLRLPQQRACRDFFGKNLTVDPLGLQAGLAHFAERIHPGRRLCLNQIITTTTTYNYYAAFSMPEQVNRALVRLCTGEGKSPVHVLSKRNSPIRPPPYLQFCIDCCEASYQKFGDLYWRRSHQLPGVLVCPIHKSILHSSSVPTTGKIAHQHSISLSDDIARTGAPLFKDIKQDSFKLLVRIAEASSELCSAHQNLPTGGDFSGDYRDTLSSLGLATSNKVFTMEANKLIEYYLAPINEFIPDLCPDDAGKKRVHALWLSKKNSSHPLRHILLRLFFHDTFTESERILNSDPRWGMGPWPCLNPLSEHHRHSVVEQIVFPDAILGCSPSLATFTCQICGFTYRKRLKSGSIEVLDLGHLSERHLLDCVREGRSLRHLATQLKISRERIITECRRLGLPISELDDWNESSQSSLNAAKVKFKSFLERHPNASRSEISSRSARIYSRLKKEVPEWLEDHLPMARQSGKTLNWDETDREFVSIVSQRSKKGRSQVPPIRVSRRFLLGNSRWTARANKFRDRLPLGIKAVDDLTETQEEFYNRSLRWAAKELKALNRNVTKTSLMNLSKLSRKALPYAEAIVLEESTKN